MPGREPDGGQLAEAPNKADHIFEAITVATVVPRAGRIVIIPDDWADLRLLKDTTENYIGGSPFSNTGGRAGEPCGASGSSSPRRSRRAWRWSVRSERRLSCSVEVGCRWRPRTSHEDFFQRDLVAIRAETRLALAVHRPQAFATADLGVAS